MSSTDQVKFFKYVSPFFTSFYVANSLRLYKKPQLVLRPCSREIIFFAELYVIQMSDIQM